MRPAKPNWWNYRALVLAGLLTVVGCAPAYTIDLNEGVAEAPRTSDIQILSEAPEAPYEVIGEFEGSERWGCLGSLPYCALQERARELGADAVWIKSRSVYEHRDEWVMVEGRLTQIRHPRIETISGVLIRYID